MEACPLGVVPSGSWTGSVCQRVSSAPCSLTRLLLCVGGLWPPVCTYTFPDCPEQAQPKRSHSPPDPGWTVNSAVLLMASSFPGSFHETTSCSVVWLISLLFSVALHQHLHCCRRHLKHGVPPSLLTLSATVGRAEWLALLGGDFSLGGTSYHCTGADGWVPHFLGVTLLLCGLVFGGTGLVACGPLGLPHPEWNLSSAHVLGQSQSVSIFMILLERLISGKKISDQTLLWRIAMLSEIPHFFFLMIGSLQMIYNCLISYGLQKNHKITISLNAHRLLWSRLIPSFKKSE